MRDIASFSVRTNSLFRFSHNLNFDQLTTRRNRYNFISKKLIFLLFDHFLRVHLLNQHPSEHQICVKNRAEIL